MEHSDLLLLHGQQHPSLMSQVTNEPLESPQGGGVYLEVIRKVGLHLTGREITGKHTDTT